MKYLILIVISISLASVFSVNVFAQSLYVNPDEDNLIKIKDSKYFASSINVLRNSNGELISVVKTEASRYLPNPITDQFIDTLPIMKEGQFAKVTALKFKKELEERGKEVQLLALTDITSDRLKNFTGIDAFIQVACPRISTDNEFDKPMLSTPQANALLKMLKNEKLDNYLEIPHWL